MRKLPIMLTVVALTLCLGLLIAAGQAPAAPGDTPKAAPSPDAKAMPEPTASGTAAMARDGWKLVWSDEFNYTGLPDPAKWDYEEGYVRNNEAQYYTRARKENAWVDGGALTITCLKDNVFQIPQGKPKGGTIAPYTAASLITRGKASWTYGRIEMRARLPQGLGVWPAFWTLGTEGGWPANGEIDIMEFVGHTPGVHHATVHFSLGGQHKSSGGSAKVDRLGEDFHIFAVDWNADRMDFYVDQTKFATFDVSKADQEGTNPFRKPQYILLNFALGGEWGRKIDDAILPQKYVVDYVRVYQRADEKK